jgi:hypothetical protein
MHAHAGELVRYTENTSCYMLLSYFSCADVTCEECYLLRRRLMVYLLVRYPDSL